MSSLPFLLGLVLHLLLSEQVYGNDELKSFPCKSHDECGFLGSAYECFNGQFCIRSTVAGCLRNKKGGGPSRVCNSNDSDEVVEMGLCRPPKKDEMEIRIYAFDWDSSIFQTWILQILLSELLDVPVSVESGNAHIDFSFYSPKEIGSNGRVFYTSFASLSRALRFAYLYGDCRLAEKKILAQYEPCAHFSPEVRAPIDSGNAMGPNEKMPELAEGQTIPELIAEPLEPAAGFGEQGLYIPKFTAERDPSLAIHFGLSGEENRKKLADAFLRPTRWSEYCSEVSPTQCADGDDVATRAPVDKMEGDRYFVPGLYTGHFRKTDKNDCEKNPLTCTGHVADFPCGIYTPLENQIFHLNLMLEIEGGNYGYQLSELSDIWHAANYTKSDVLLYWMQPTLLSQEYAGTDAEFTKVTFPPPSQDCIDARKKISKAKCLPRKPDSFGDPEAVCDDPPFQLQKATSTSLRKLLIDGVPQDIQSPSYAVLKAYTLPEMELSKFLEDLKGYEDPHLAVCDWVNSNMDTLQKFVPPTYPRVQQDLDLRVLLYISLSLGTIAALLVIWTGRKVYLNRKNNIIRFAQFEFLSLVLVGSLLTALGAIIGSFPQNDGICVAEIWLVYLGYTLALVPQIVKVAAINRLMSAARRYERLQLNLKHLYGAVTVFSLFAVFYLALWTALDSPHTLTRYTLSDSVTASGETIVFTSYNCGSEMSFWEFIAFAWNGLLLVSSVVLAVQSRNVVKEFNESQTLGILIYTNFVFFMFRGLTYYLERVADPSIILRYRSMIYALDVIASLAVYFWPKLVLCNKTARSGIERNPAIRPPSFESDFGSARYIMGSNFVTPAAPNRPMLTKLPSNRFVRLLTNISHITFHPNEDDSLSFREDVESDGKSQESTKIDGDTYGDGVEMSGDLSSRSGNKSNVQKSTASVGVDPSSPVSSLPESSQYVKGDVERPLNGSEEVPLPMASSSSSSETASLSARILPLSSSEKVSTSDQESTASSMPPLTSYYSGTESLRDSEASFSETESYASPILQSPKPTIAQAMPSAASLPLIPESDRELEMSFRSEASAMAPIIPVRRPSLSNESLSNQEASLLSEVPASIFSISDEEEHC